jgi:hydroxyacylglutathione hydrolase
LYRSPFKIEPATNIKHLNDRDVLKFGPIELEVIHTPGHTEGGVCFVEKNHKVIFAGDTIFRESCGRVDLPGGSMQLISRSINELIMLLPEDFTIYSGHGPATTVGHEKTNNPFVN